MRDINNPKVCSARRDLIAGLMAPASSHILDRSPREAAQPAEPASNVIPLFPAVRR